MSILTLMLSVSQDTEPDLFSAIFARDWAAVGGWSLFVMLTLAVTFTVPRWFAKEIVVPGSVYRRQVEANEKLLTANEALTTQNGQLITSNQIVEHFFKETVPKRGEVPEWDTSPSEEVRSLGQTPTI